VTVANDETESEMLQGVGATREFLPPDAAADSTDVANGELEKVVDKEISSEEMSSLSDDQLTESRSPIVSFSPGNNNSSSATGKADTATCSCDQTETHDAKAVIVAATDDLLADDTPRQNEFVGTETNGRTKTTSVHRRWRSLGAGSRLRRVVDLTSCDKAVNVDEDDLLAQLEQPNVVSSQPQLTVRTDSETTAALYDSTTNEERQELEKEEETAKENEDKKAEDTTQTVSASESTPGSAGVFGNVVVDLDELGILTTQDVKHEEVCLLSL